MTRLKSPGQALVTRVLFVGKVIGPQAIGPGAADGGLVAVAFAKLRIIQYATRYRSENLKMSFLSLPKWIIIYTTLLYYYPTYARHP